MESVSNKTQKDEKRPMSHSHPRSPDISRGSQTFPVIWGLIKDTGRNNEI